MTHKVVTIKTGRHKVISYIDTEISFERSLSEIQTLLLKYNCERIIHDYQLRQRGSVVEPLHTLGFVQKGTKFIIEFPVVFLERKSGKVLRMEVSGRIMFNKIKALLIDVELGYLDFREAMIPYAALQAPDGRIVSVTDAFIESSDQLQQGIFFPQLGSGK